MQQAEILTTGFTAQEYPHYIKYMGSKTKIMDFVVTGIDEVYSGGAVLDLFAGSASLSGALYNQVCIHSNDIQNYSSILAQVYLTAWQGSNSPSVDRVIAEAEIIANRHIGKLTSDYSYEQVSNLDHFNEIEAKNRNLMSDDFFHDFHLFSKFYSGTWWSAEQCIWIDAFREVAENYRNDSSFAAIMASLMYAMAYTSQGTGHYAQYRDAKTNSSMKDILIYRKRDFVRYFRRKLLDAYEWLPKNKSVHKHKATSLDFIECLKQFEGGTVYADPPYCFVHYSRFYHALETVVLYDYPAIQIKGGKVVKGRYREGRHQSPFCIKTQVKGAFKDMFDGIAATQSNMVLSYSNTGMITMDELEKIACSSFGSAYGLEVETTDHKHMTLGRQGDRHRDVEECLILAMRK